MIDINKKDNTQIELHIIAFGIAKDVLGGSSIRLSFKCPLSVGGLLEELKLRYPAFAELRSLAIAINENYAQHDQLIQATDEVVIIPPVAGG